jgi:hypothetical protein
MVCWRQIPSSVVRLLFLTCVSVLVWFISLKSLHSSTTVRIPLNLFTPQNSSETVQYDTIDPTFLNPNFNNTSSSSNITLLDVLGSIDVQKLREVTDLIGENGENGFQIIKTVPVDRNAMNFKGFGTISGHFDKYCFGGQKKRFLEKSVWRECVQRNVSVEELALVSPCANGSFIAKAANAFIDRASRHRSVPGTIFDQERYFRPQFYVRQPKIEQNSKVKKFKKLATVLQAYTSAKGHFPHETLPRLIWLAQELPEDVPILIMISDIVQKYLNALYSLGIISKDRIVVYDQSYIYFAEEVYFANEYGFCNNPSPHKGGTNTFYPPYVLDLVRKALTSHIQSSDGNAILVIKREGSTPKSTIARSISNHNQLMTWIRKNNDLNRTILEYAQPKKSLLGEIALFHQAQIVIAPHGAGLANLLFCRPGTTVIEVGFPKWGPQMSLDPMYYQVATALQLDYWLLMAESGTYTTSMQVNIQELECILQSCNSSQLEHLGRAHVLPNHRLVL